MATNLEYKTALIVLKEFGKIYGKTFLQKFFFLLQHEQIPDLKFNYIKYLYGPYSEDLNNLTKEFIKLNLMNESIGLTRSANFLHVYSLTKDGELEAEKIKILIDEKLLIKIESFCSKFKELTPSQILKYVYEKYPEWTENSVLAH